MAPPSAGGPDLGYHRHVPDRDSPVAAFDASRPHVARVYDYLLGGKDNFAADRAVGQQMIASLPAAQVGVRGPRAGRGPDGLRRLLAESDYVVLAAALTGETKALLGPAQISQMKPSAWLINIARGGLADEPALIEALQSKKIAGACLDVFAQEPLPQDSPLWEMPNVHIAPHNSPGWTAGLHERQKALFLSNLRRFASSEPLQSVVDIARGY